MQSWAAGMEAWDRVDTIRCSRSTARPIPARSPRRRPGLLADHASFVTGQALAVNGGLVTQ
jgi:hypothetical protein